VHLEVEELAGKAGGAFSRGLHGIEYYAGAGWLALFNVRGQRASVSRRPTDLEKLGKTVRYVGKAGEAAKVKALVNMVMNINTAGLAEGLGLGEALGLDLTMLREVFSETGAASRVLQTDGEDMQNREHSCFFLGRPRRQGQRHRARSARELGLDLPLAAPTKRSTTP
jgi:3-hydroxyisobutyrate dehydrogenase